MPKTNSMRILAGQYKNRQFASPESSLTHPMGAREKNALFNMLQPYLNDTKVLDAYAGTGALGLEALSRGAREAVFVEANGKIARFLNANLDRVLSPDFTFATIYSYPVAEFANFPNYYDYFDLIIADPPYDNFQPTEVGNLAKCLKTSGIFALSLPAKFGAAPDFPGLTLLKQHNYAAASLAIYQKS